MRRREFMGLSTLAAVSLTWGTGCNQSTDVDLAPAQAIKFPETKPMPKDPKKGGGPGSSGNAGKNPGESS